jgi:hypothetical protein
MKFTSNLMTLMFAVLMGTTTLANAHNVELTEPGPISIPSSKPLSTKEIRKAILHGVERHNWKVESDSPGVIRIKLDGRRDRAVLVMDVVYDTKSYSIKYVSSEGLRYNGKTIHSSYSRWITNLTSSIDTELRTID